MDVASSVECYIMEHNVPSEVALARISSFVEDAWKTINQAPFKYPALFPVVQRVTSLAKSMTLCSSTRGMRTHTARTSKRHWRAISSSIFLSNISEQCVKKAYQDGVISSHGSSKLHMD